MSEEKIYCYDNPSKSDNTALLAALMNGNKDSTAETMAMMLNNSSNSWNNNPFIYLVWLMFMRYMNGNGWGNGGETQQGENYNSRAIAQLLDTVNTNHNNDLVLQGINGNASAIGDLANSFGTSTAVMQGAINDVRAAVDRVAGQSGITGERVINSVILGNKDLTLALQSCCCENKLLVTNMGYEGLIRDLLNTLLLSNNINCINNTLTNKFALMEYDTANLTCSINQNISAQTLTLKDTANANTLSIIGKLNEMQTNALLDKISELLETKSTLQGLISQELQNLTIYNMISPLLALINAIKAAQPSTTTVQYPLLTVVPSYLTSGYYNTNGAWA